MLFNSSLEASIKRTALVACIGECLSLCLTIVLMWAIILL